MAWRVRASLLVCRRFWETFRVFNDLFREIHVEIGPIVMARRRLFHVDNRLDCLVLKSWEVLVGHEHFPVLCQQPNAVSGDVGYFNCRVRMVVTIQIHDRGSA